MLIKLPLIGEITLTFKSKKTLDLERLVESLAKEPISIIASAPQLHTRGVIGATGMQGPTGTTGLSGATGISGSVGFSVSPWMQHHLNDLYKVKDDIDQIAGYLDFQSPGRRGRNP